MLFSLLLLFLPLTASSFSLPSALNKAMTPGVDPCSRLIIPSQIQPSSRASSYSSSALFVGHEFRLEDKAFRLQKNEKQKTTEAADFTNKVASDTAITTVTTTAAFTESPLRSIAKSLLWRVIAGSITFSASLRFTGGNLATAISIVGSDFLSKSFTMFVGERLMNKSQAGRNQAGNDDVGRSLMKALVWRLFAIANTLTMALFFAKDLSVANKIVGLDALFKTSLMFGYERFWAKIQWGKEAIEPRLQR